MTPNNQNLRSNPSASYVGAYAESQMPLRRARFDVRRVHLVGAQAQALLTQSGFSGTVLAVFSDTVYLLGTGEEILWLTQERSPAHRRCIQVSFHAHTLKTGMGFAVLGDCLRVGDATIIDLADADSWTARTFDPGRLLPLGGVRARFWKTLTAFRSLPGSNGLSRALGVIAAPARNGEGSTLSSSETALIDQASPAIQELAGACRARDMVRIARSGLRLVGLGPGLTPSGDDYLGGLLFTAHCLKAAYPTKFSWGIEPILDFLHRARPLTNRISHTVLFDLAHGHGPEPLHDLVNSFLEAETAERLRCSVDRLTGIGHTSGWDMLAGALTGMLLTETNACLKVDTPARGNRMIGPAYLSLNLAPVIEEDVDG